MKHTTTGGVNDILAINESDNPILIVLYNYFLARALLHQLSRRNKIDLQ
jgi:hypothetical protein